MPPYKPPAAILIQSHRSHPHKQRDLAARYADEHGLRVVGICHEVVDCCAMLINKTVQAVISTLDPGDEARDLIETAGGQLHVVRPTDEPARPRRDVPTLVVRMWQAGIGQAEIAKILGVTVSGVRRALGRRRPNAE